MTAIGARVLAIRNGDGETKTLYVFGAGVYAGDFVPPIDGFPAVNPRIDLDNGNTTWGIECWWGPEHRVRGEYPEPEWTYVEVPPTLSVPS